MKEKIRRYKRPAETVQDPEIEELRHSTRGSVYRTPGRTEPELKLTSEQREQLKVELEKQYHQSLKVLRKYEFPFEGTHGAHPSWEKVERGLTYEVLDRIAKLQSPVLLLLPPNFARQKALSMIHVKSPFQSSHIIPNPDADVDLWNGGRSEQSANWKIGIAEGLPEMEADPKITGNNYEMSQSWLLKYLAEGLDVINDLDTYLMLVIRTLTLKKTIDTNTLTILNAKNVKNGSRLAFGSLSKSEHYLGGTAHSHVFFKNIRLRPIVWVKPADEGNLEAAQS